MNKTSFLSMVIVAFLLSVLAAALFMVLSSIFSSAFAIRFAIAAVSFSYIVYLLFATEQKVGRIIVGVMCVVMFVLLFSLPLGVNLYTLAHIIVISAVRSLYFHNGLMATFFDFGLTAISYIVSVWALNQSSSLFLSFWSFFLIQACVIPVLNTLSNRSNKNFSGKSMPGDQRIFQQAYRSAESALRRASDARII